MPQPDPQTHPPWPFLGSPMSVPWIVFGNPKHSMYAIYAHIDPPNHPNVGKYGIHGVSGNCFSGMCSLGRPRRRAAGPGAAALGGDHVRGDVGVATPPRAADGRSADRPAGVGLAGGKTTSGATGTGNSGIHPSHGASERVIHEPEPISI